MRSALEQRRQQRADETGFTTIEMVACFAFSMFLMVGLLNILFIEYARGALRAAADESARAGARVYDETPGVYTNAITKCLDRQAEALQPLKNLATVTDNKCEVVNGQIRTTISADYRTWVPSIRPISDTATAVSVKEQAPQ